MQRLPVRDKVCLAEHPGASRMFCSYWHFCMPCLDSLSISAEYSSHLLWLSCEVTFFPGQQLMQLHPGFVRLQKKKKVFMFVLTFEVSFTTDKMLVEISVLVASALWTCGSRVLWIPQWCLLYLSLVLLSFSTFLWHSTFLSSETFGSFAVASWSDIPVYLFCRVHWVHWTLVPGRVRVDWRNL